jgi:hypothetical protein
VADGIRWRSDPTTILGHRDTCPVKGAPIGKQISLALRPLLHQLDSADEEKPRCGSSKQLLPCRSPCDLPGPAPSALTRRCSSTCTDDARKSARGRRIRPDRIRRVTGSQSRCPTVNFSCAGNYSFVAGDAAMTLSMSGASETGRGRPALSHDVIPPAGGNAMSARSRECRNAPAPQSEK